MTDTSNARQLVVSASELLLITPGPSNTINHLVFLRHVRLVMGLFSLST